VGEKIAGYVGQIVALLGEIMDGLEAGVGISIDERSGECMEHGAIGDAQNASDSFGGEFVSIDADPREDLIEEAHAIAHGSSGFAGDDRERGVFEGDVFLFQDKLQTSGDALRAD
jgi:hypothetical protein